MALKRKKKEKGSAPKPPRRGRGSSDSAQPKGAGRFVMIIGDDGAILVYLRGNTVVRRLFAPSPQPDHTASFVDLMQANPKVPLWILADVLDQQYVRHSFPPVSSFSVNNLVKRQLERDFQAEDLKGSLPLGRDKTGRKEWNYLLIALANTPLMQHWLELIVELPNELKGLYLAPVEGQNYIPELKKHLDGDEPEKKKRGKKGKADTAVQSWQLLVTHNKVSGFRQIVLRDSKLVFTRVTQAIDDAVAAVVAGNIEQEIINTIEYLRRLGFQDSATLEIIVVAAQEVKESLDLKRFNAGATHVLTPLDVADMLELQQAALSADRFGDVVMASWFARTRKRRLKLMTAYGGKLSRLYQARRALIAIGALIVIAMLVLSARNLLGYMTNNSEAANIEGQRAPLQAEKTTLQAAIDGLDKDVAFKASVVAAHDAYLKDAISPLEFVTELAPYISEDYRVAELAWAPSAAAPGSPEAAAGPLEIRVAMEFLGNYSDVETLTNAADTYIALLKQELPRYEITASAYPWSRGNAGLEISFDQADNLAQAGNRRVDLIFRGPKPAAATAGAASPGAPEMPAGPGGPPGMGMPGAPDMGGEFRP